MGMFPRKEGGIKVLAGLAPSSQTVRSLLRKMINDSAFSSENLANMTDCLFVKVIESVNLMI